MSKKPMFGCLCNALFCCSCSRRLDDDDKPARSGRCRPRYCLLSPATIALAIDAVFLLSLVWVLFDAAQVMRVRYHDWWWALPAAFSAPAMLVLLLKLRYVRRFCDVKWSEDIDWNARIILVPLIGALANTFMVSCWLACAPLYVAELVRHNKSSLDDFREQTVALLGQASSVLFMLSYGASVVCAVLVSVRHRRVVLGYIRRSNEGGTSLLRTPAEKIEEDEPSLYQKAEKVIYVAAPAYQAPVPAPVVKSANSINRNELLRGETMDRFDSMRSTTSSPVSTLRHGVAVLPPFVPESNHSSNNNDDDDGDKSDSRVDSPRSRSRRSSKRKQ